jgi:hypothetical protein
MKESVGKTHYGVGYSEASEEFDSATSLVNRCKYVMAAYVYIGAAMKFLFLLCSGSRKRQWR